MTIQEISKLEQYFTCYSTGPYKSPNSVCRKLYHKEYDDFHIIIFNEDKEVYQANTDHECFGIELETINDLIKRFESFTGQNLYDIKLNISDELQSERKFNARYEEENIEEQKEPEEPEELSYDQRVELLYKNRLIEAKAKGQKFMSPQIWTNDIGPSTEYMDSKGIPRFKVKSPWSLTVIKQNEQGTIVQSDNGDTQYLTTEEFNNLNK